MNNLSFKAQINGLESQALKFLFEKQTDDDKKHSIEVVKASHPMDDDTFILRKNGKTTAVYSHTFREEENMTSFEKLLSIFKILKVKEAQSALRKNKRNT